MLIKEDVRKTKEKWNGRKPVTDAKENDNVNHTSSTYFT
jgi:hypothetical protein